MIYVLDSGVYGLGTPGAERFRGFQGFGGLRIGGLESTG